MVDGMSVSVGRDYEIGRIREFMFANDLSGPQVAAIFEAGVTAAQALCPGLFGRHTARLEPRSHADFIAAVLTYAEKHSLSGEQLCVIFNGGTGPARCLLPELFPAAPQCGGEGG